MKCIVAVAADWGIGKNGNLLAHNSEDMKFFKEQTTGQIVIMGRKTLESFPRKRPLPARDNIVITRDLEFTCEGAYVVHSVDEAAVQAERLQSAFVDACDTSVGKEIFVIGGESIYRQMLAYCDTVYVTKMNQTYDADTYFPNLDEDADFVLATKSEMKEYSDGTFCFCTYRRK